MSLHLPHNCFTWLVVFRVLQTFPQWDVNCKSGGNYQLVQSGRVQLFGK